MVGRADHIFVDALVNRLGNHKAFGLPLALPLDNNRIDLVGLVSYCPGFYVFTHRVIRPGLAHLLQRPARTDGP